ncbi:MAG: DUF1272 domain-containing protein [Anaerolineales bacterium]|nr:DUF1272 domain-containing protein [Anaerolineales bacterium]
MLQQDLLPSSAEVYICSFECTFCAECAQDKLDLVCPNCGGGLVRRPIRPAHKLLEHPASAQRVYKPEGCTA